MMPEPLRYQWPKIPILAPSFEPPAPYVTYRQMDMNEVRECLRQNGYTIVRSSRIISCWGEQLCLDYEFAYFKDDPEFIAVAQRQVARTAAQEAMKYATATVGDHEGHRAKQFRAEIVVIKPWDAK